ncbi:MAG: FAD-binding protein [Nitrospirae bacterium]|nr:FAD-binding protein [Nitrospirota bacterium]
MERLKGIIGSGKVSTERADLLCYGFDASKIKKPPSAVVWAEDITDVVKLTKFAYENDLPIIPRGAGTSTTGSAVPVDNAIVLSLERMDRILEIDTDNLFVMVEPGVINGRLQKELGIKGFFYPPDPASMDFCTIGGNVAVNAGGPRAIKYGVTGDYVQYLEAVLPDGRVIEAGVRTKKGVVGYDLKSLLVGSEGTLAIITKIGLRILPEPETVITLLAFYSSLRKATETVPRIISQKVIPRTLEFMDRRTIEAIESYNPSGLKDAEAVLLIELDGPVKTVQRETERVVDICNRMGASVEVADDSITQQKIWATRRAISPALYHISPTKINEDIVVPVTGIPDIIEFLEQLSQRYKIPIASFGHAGDGNIHVNIMVDKKDQKQYEKALSMVKEIFQETLKLGGTISGEHGVGLTKADYIDMEIHNNEMDLMKGIKRLFDHKMILNRGKVFP